MDIWDTISISGGLLGLKMNKINIRIDEIQLKQVILCQFYLNVNQAPKKMLGTIVHTLKGQGALVKGS